MRLDERCGQDGGNVEKVWWKSECLPDDLVVGGKEEIVKASVNLVVYLAPSSSCL